jgi:hypothetical protein
MVELLTTKKKALVVSAIILLALGSWVLFSLLDFGQAQRDILSKDTLRMQVNYTKF